MTNTQLREKGWSKLGTTTIGNFRKILWQHPTHMSDGGGMLTVDAKNHQRLADAGRCRCAKPEEKR